jgi:hypothetical protein
MVENGVAAIGPAQPANRPMMEAAYAPQVVETAHMSAAQTGTAHMAAADSSEASMATAHAAAADTATAMAAASTIAAAYQDESAVGAHCCSLTVDRHGS